MTTGQTTSADEDHVIWLNALKDILKGPFNELLHYEWKNTASHPTPLLQYCVTEAAEISTIWCQLSLKLTIFILTLQVLALFKQHFSQYTLKNETTAQSIDIYKENKWQISKYTLIKNSRGWFFQSAGCFVLSPNHCRGTSDCYILVLCVFVSGILFLSD